MFLAVLKQRRAAAGGIGGDGAQQPLELVRARAVELAVGAARQLGDLGKHARSNAITALLEHEHRQAEQTELARLVAYGVDILLAAIADADHGVQPALAA